MVVVMAVRAARVVAVARVRARLCRSRVVAEAVIVVTRGKRAKMLVAGGVIAAGLTGALVGCGAADTRTDTTDRDLAVAHVRVDGRDVVCVIYNAPNASGAAGGLACDFGRKP